MKYFIYLFFFAVPCLSTCQTWDIHFKQGLVVPTFEKKRMGSDINGFRNYGLFLISQYNEIGVRHCNTFGNLSFSLGIGGYANGFNLYMYPDRYPKKSNSTDFQYSIATSFGIKSKIIYSLRRIELAYSREFYKTKNLLVD